jgi:O-methyltransferase involved in polyketide biosynthesis
MQTEKVQFTQEKETLLATLYGRALESQSQDPILRDPAAEEAIRRIDYDFKRFKMSTTDMLGIASRAKLIDLWTAEYIDNNPQATVLYLGCGLDSRVFRIDPPEGIQWFDVDYPDVIDLRRRLFPERAGYHMIGSSVVAEGWLDEIPADRPTMIVAEGLLMYLSADETPALLERLVNYFPGGQLAFDAVSRLGLKLQKTNKAVSATGAVLGWGLDDPHELEQRIPRLKLITAMTAVDPDLPGIHKMPGSTRKLLSLMRHIPALRKLAYILRYQF